MATTLREMARSNGKTLGQLGIPTPTAHAINAGIRRAGPSSISRIATATGTLLIDVAAACDESWRQGQARRGQPAAPPAVDPGAAGQAQSLHTGQSAQPVAGGTQ